MKIQKVPGERIVAAIIDAVIIGIVGTIFMVLYAAFTGFENFMEVILSNSNSVLGDIESPTASYMLWTALIDFVPGFIYFVIVPWKWNGQTVGKKIMSIKAIDEFGNNPSLYKHFLRSIQMWGTYVTIPLLLFMFVNMLVFSLVSGLFGFGVVVLTFIAFIMLLSREDGKGLHDMIAGTYVVKADFDGLVDGFNQKATMMGDWAEVKQEEDDGFGEDIEDPEPSNEEDPWKY